MDETGLIVVLMTASDEDEAARLANALVERKLAACVQILPGIKSVYRWREAVQTDSEVLLLAKTTSGNFARLVATVQELHSYETPEIVALPAAQVSNSYLAWLNANVLTDGEIGASTN